LQCDLAAVGLWRKSGNTVAQICCPLSAPDSGESTPLVLPKMCRQHLIHAYMTPPQPANVL
jgi:hypothetical protein